MWCLPVMQPINHEVVNMPVYLWNMKMALHFTWSVHQQQQHPAACFQQECTFSWNCVKNLRRQAETHRGKFNDFAVCKYWTWSICLDNQAILNKNIYWSMLWKSPLFAFKTWNQKLLNFSHINSDKNSWF